MWSLLCGPTSSKKFPGDMPAEVLVLFFLIVLEVVDELIHEAIIAQPVRKDEEW